MDQMNTSNLKTKLTHTLEMTNMHLTAIESIYNESVTSSNTLMERMDQITKSYTADMRKMQQNARHLYDKIQLDHQKAVLYIEEQKKQLEEREKLLRHREAEIEMEVKKLHNDTRMPEKTTMEQKKSENVMRLEAYQKLDAKKDDGFDDRISGLPDDILVNVISRLTFSEAERTSLLSTRWRYLWTLLPDLCFDVSNEVKELLTVTQDEATLDEVRSRYISWVSKALELHRGSKVKVFRLCFHLGDSHRSNITKWICSVIDKGIQEFELNFHHPWWDHSNSQYAFGQECYDRLKVPSGLSAIKSLRSVCLDSVDVNQEFLEFLIHNCPNLEQLRVASANYLCGLKVVGSSLQLKYLEIFRCSRIKEIEISVPSLVSFKYDGPVWNLHIENVPLLVDASLGRSYCYMFPFAPNLSFLSQLETLELEFDRQFVQLSVGELPKLRHLTCTLNVYANQSLLRFNYVLMTCPSLQKFTLKFKYYPDDRWQDLPQIPTFSHQHLKVVELIGIARSARGLEFASCLLENAVMLEKMIIEPMPDDCLSEKAQRFVKKLERKAPKGVELVIR